MDGTWNPLCLGPCLMAPHVLFLFPGDNEGVGGGREGIGGIDMGRFRVVIIYDHHII